LAELDERPTDDPCSAEAGVAVVCPGPAWTEPIALGGGLCAGLSGP
jgi:hypothetical protein